MATEINGVSESIFAEFVEQPAKVDSAASATIHSKSTRISELQEECRIHRGPGRKLFLIEQMFTSETELTCRRFISLMPFPN
jgi:hypothetical protein